MNLDHQSIGPAVVGEEEGPPVVGRGGAAGEGERMGKRLTGEIEAGGLKNNLMCGSHGGWLYGV
jgi:hypothetical protein